MTTDHAGLIERLRIWTSGSPMNATPTAIASDLAQASMKILASFAQHLATIAGQSLSLRLTADTYVKLQAAGVPIEHVVRLNRGTSSLLVLVVEEKSWRTDR